MPKKKDKSDQTHIIHPNNSDFDKKNVSSTHSVVNKQQKQPKNNSFPIVGIGASAGGLDALKRLFSHVPSDNKMAFVVVQHMDPNYKSNLASILSGYTSMKTVPIEDEMIIRPEHVYVIPPNKDLSLINGKLVLLIPEKPHAIRNPIDFFFKNLANDQKENAICIILSGFGSDGTEGLKLIKAGGGLAIVQDPNTADSDNMPRSAIKTGQVDFVLAPEEIPEKLIAYLKSSKKINQQIFSPDEQTSKNLNKILVLIRTKTGYDFSFYKENTINRRIVRRMNIHQIHDYSSYIRYLRTNPNEIEMLFNDILINVTDFFRDPKAYESFKEKLPDLIHLKSPRESIRVWVPGCSTGEEVYSIAIILREVLDELQVDLDIQIFGTDLDSEAIKKARNGIYPQSIGDNVDETRLEKFFIKKEDKYIIKKNIRDTAIFAIHDAIRDPPFAYLDIISCRNLLIYLKDIAQKKLLSHFEYSLKENGILFLGSSESIGDYLDVFIPLDKKWKIYKSIYPTKNRPHHPYNYFPTPTRLDDNLKDYKRISGHNITQTAKNQLIDTFVPPSVLIDKFGEILYIHGKIGRYLEFASGKTTVNIFDMAREGLKFELNSAVQRAISTNKNVHLENLAVKSDSDLIFVNISVKSVKDDNETLLIVSFESVTTPKDKKNKIKFKPALEKDNRIIELEKELRLTKEELMEKVADMNTSYEELKAANEELQSLNEESQSTNEELETAKEELQSVNEEMISVNAELQMTIDDLTRSNDDLHNLMNSIQSAVLFLDSDLNVKKFTKETTKLINLIDSDVGRPIHHIVSNIKYNRFEEDLKNVMATHIPKEIEIQNINNKWYFMRIMPYKTLEDIIDGLVITFSDITQQKTAQKQVQDALFYANSIIDTIREPLIILDKDLNIESANKSFYKTFKMNKSETEGIKLYDLLDEQWNIKKLRELLENVLPKNTHFEDFEVENNFPNVGHKKMLVNARKVYRKESKMNYILMSMEMEK